jgi:hypothetical protein
MIRIASVHEVGHSPSCGGRQALGVIVIESPL